MSKVMIIYHSQEYGNTGQMADAIAEGVKAGGCDDVKLVNTNQDRVDFKEYGGCKAVALGSPDYYSYIAGGIKMFMDDWYIYKKTMENLVDKKYALFYSHGGGGKVARSLEEMGKRLGEKVSETVESRGTPDDQVLKKCRDLGKELAASVK
jgi:NAD(P)H dehydrogenase (quinone)